MQITSFTFNPFSENTWLLWDETRACVVVDPGCSNKRERDELLEFVEQKNLKPEAILNTHCHLDHVWGNRFLKDAWKVPLICPKGEESNLRHSETAAALYGIPGFEPSPDADVWLENETEFRFGSTILEILKVPGHTSGHVAFYHRQTGMLISGDVLFLGSIGRTDFPGGSYPVLMKSITGVLLPLGDDVVVCNGHGPRTTLGHEARTNPFILEYVQR